MLFKRHIAFWIVALVVFVGMFWLRHHILLTRFVLQRYRASPLYTGTGST